MNKAFDVRVVEEQQPHYVPAYVEITYNSGVQTTTFRLSPGSATLLADQLRDAAAKAEGMHHAAAQPRRLDR